MLVKGIAAPIMEHVRGAGWARLSPRGGWPLSWFWNQQVCLEALEEDLAWFLFGHILGKRPQTVTQPLWSPFPGQARLPQVSSCSMSGPTRR